jgi:RNase P/RNase MRP subunit POP5
MVRRYLLVRILSERGLSGDQFNELLIQTVKKSFGEIGFVRVNPKLIHFNAEKAEAIVACERGRVMDLEAALALATDHLGVTIALITTRVSGTIKSLRKRRAGPQK